MSNITTVECTWGDGPDVLLTIANKAGKWQFDFSAEAAKYLAMRLEQAADQAEFLEETAKAEGGYMDRVTVVRIKNIIPHPTKPEKYQIIDVGLTRLVTGIHYAIGQLGLYIPPDAIVPDKLAEEMELLGRLGGAKKNKARSRNFDGINSPGIFYGQEGPSWNPNWVEGQDVTSEVGINFGE